MRIAIVGSTGLVGKELIQLLEDYEPVLFDSKSAISFEKIDLAFFCVSKELAQKLIPAARDSGVLCIDSSAAFRLDPNVPLVIPEINAHLLENHQGIIASPNCTTTLMLLALAPLHKHFKIKRVFVATYQSISGAGKHALESFEKKPVFNVYLHESKEKEEQKMLLETQKILEDETIAVMARCVRVPVARVHSQAVNVEFNCPVEKEMAIEVLKSAPGLVLKENPSALDAAGQKHVFCGDIRNDFTQDNTLDMWVVGDQLLKGAALNMFQIAECLNSQKKIASGGF